LKTKSDIPKGFGPLHFVFNGKGDRLFVINELNLTIITFEKDGKGYFK